MAKIQTSRGVFRYKPKFIYLGIKQIDKEKSLENLRLVSEVLRDKDFTFSPAYGSLLGIIRDNDFITWDEDIDCVIKEEDEEKFKDALWDLKAVGFSLIRYERRGLYSIMRNGEYIDFYVLNKISENIRQTRGGSYLFEKYLDDTKVIDFKGVSLVVPREAEEFLEFQYGDWRTPVQYADFNQSRLWIFLTLCVAYIKNHLPDALYFYLLRKHHQPQFEQFKRKCAQKGILIPDEVRI